MTTGQFLEFFFFKRTFFRKIQDIFTKNNCKNINLGRDIQTQNKTQNQEKLPGNQFSERSTPIAIEKSIVWCIFIFFLFDLQKFGFFDITKIEWRVCLVLI